MKLLLLFALAFIHLHVNAQVMQSKLCTTWRNTYTECSEGYLLESPPGVNEYTKYNTDGTYESWTTGISKSKNSIVSGIGISYEDTLATGTWSLDTVNMILTLKKYQTIEEHLENYFPPERKFKITKLTDSELVFEYTDHDGLLYIEHNVPK